MEERSSAPGAELEVQDLVEEEEKSPGNVSNESAPSSSAPNNIEDILDTDIPPSNRNTRETESAEPSSPTDSQFFECNICYDPVRQPVVTLCGHLFCWPCIYRWLEQSPSCPVCKAGASRDKLIPIYGRNSEGNITEDPRDTIPERPAAQRPEPVQQQRHPFENFFQPQFMQGGVSFSAGFSPFGLQMQWPNTPTVPLTEQQQHQLFVSRVLFGVGIVIFIILFFL